MPQATPPNTQIAPDYAQYVPAPPKYVQPEIVSRLFPGVSEDVINEFAGSGGKLTIGTTPPEGTPAYVASENVLYTQPLAGQGSLIHELVHFAQTKAPHFFDTRDLTPAQEKVHSRAVASMTAFSNPGINLATLNAFVQGGLEMKALQAQNIQSLRPDVIWPQGQIDAEQAAFSIAGGQTQSQAFPASYFQNFFAGGLGAAQYDWEKNILAGK